MELGECVEHSLLYDMVAIAIAHCFRCMRQNLFNLERQKWHDDERVQSFLMGMGMLITLNATALPTSRSVSEL